jgi:hypothetical protein
LEGLQIVDITAMCCIVRKRFCEWSLRTSRRDAARQPVATIIVHACRCIGKDGAEATDLARIDDDPRRQGGAG